MADVKYDKLQALIVDDFDSFRMTVSKMLQGIGIHQVDSAVNGAEALRHCRQKAYDLILCDYNLGKGKTGQQVLEELRLHQLPGSDGLFILVSAESSKSIIMAAYDYEPDGYLTKPITNKTLEQRLVRLFAQRARMAPIMAAVKEKNIERAIILCRNEIAASGRSANQCQKLLGQLYLQLGDYPKAEAVYREVLEARQLDWAQLGMARVKKMQGDLLSAQQWLEEVIDGNPLALKAYDLQAEILREQNAYARLQETLEKAVDISPFSILRQQQLGDVAIFNNDALTAANAYRRTVKLGEYSCYDRLDNHTGFLRATLMLFKEDKNQAKGLVRDALKVASEMEQRFGKTPEQKLEVALLESQLLVCQGEKQKAEDLVKNVQAALLIDEPTLGLEIEMVKSLLATGQKAASEALLKELLNKYQGHEAELEKIDSILEEPVSTKNRSKVAAINKQGIALYEANDYSGAIACFENAQHVFPNHIGIRLNLVQALIDKFKLSPDEKDFELAQTSLVRVGEMLSTEHDQFRRYRQLLEMLRACQRKLDQ
jgi:CheY-like chemotaxis protein